MNVCLELVIYCDNVQSGEGRYIKIYHVRSGRLLDRVKIFGASRVHGFAYCMCNMCALLQSYVESLW